MSLHNRILSVIFGRLFLIAMVLWIAALIAAPFITIPLTIVAVVILRARNSA